MLFLEGKIMTPAPRLRCHEGWPILSTGFRPFFLLGSIYAGVAILVWLPVFMGELALTTAFAPRDWHVHEMLYGYLAAVITGFLFTAIPNWTGRLPIQGKPLLGLVVLWLAGRVCVTFSLETGWLPAMLIDTWFLSLVVAAAAREIIAGRKWANLNVVLLVLVLLAGNVAFHLEAHFNGAADISIRVGITVVVMLISLIGGRIIPSFTRNWLARENPGRLPAPSPVSICLSWRWARWRWCLGSSGLAVQRQDILLLWLAACILSVWAVGLAIEPGGSVWCSFCTSATPSFRLDFC